MEKKAVQSLFLCYDMSVVTGKGRQLLADGFFLVKM